MRFSAHVVLFLLFVANCAISGENNAAATPLSPAESLKKFKVPDDLQLDQVLADPDIAQPVFMNFDEHGRMWVVEYRQYPQPAGLKVVSHDSVWRAVYDKVPEPPPKGMRGLDRITIHEDTDGDGIYDKHTVFVDGLNIATAVERGRGGVWVLNPPYLLFYPDKNNDDVPDGPPEVHLQGFGLEDTHSVINSLRWGPDGWLYAAQGSTVTGNIRKPNEPETSAVHSLGQLIWRYQPDTRRYEIFAEGGGNTFGVELDSKGRIFSGHNGGDTRGFHYVQGGYSRKGFDKHGPLSNPYTFGYFPQIEHATKAPRFTHTFVTNEGSALPDQYRGKIFCCQPLEGKIVESELIADGSTFKTKDVADVVTSTDKYFRPVDIKIGPDGAIYFADWYESAVAHANNYERKLGTETGRIYRLRAKDAKRPKPVDLSKHSGAELMEALKSENRWQRQAALHVIGERKDAALIPQLIEAIEKSDGQPALESLWALYQCGGFNDSVALKAFEHKNAFVRLWAVRFACDDHQVSPTIARALESLTRREQYIETRNQLACSARRLPLADSFPIVRALLTHSEDKDDKQIPLLLWWAIEAKCETERDNVVKFFTDPALWDLPIVRGRILENVMRRFAASGTRESLLACAQLLQAAPSQDHAKILLGGFEKAFEGRSIPPLPTELLQAMSKAGGDSLLLDIRMAKAESIDNGLKILGDAKQKPSKRLPLAQIFGEMKEPRSVPLLLAIVTKDKDLILRKAALTALQQYDEAAIAETLITEYKSLGDEIRPVAQTVLASRPAWTLQLLKALDSGVIGRETITRETVENLRLNEESDIVALTDKFFGKKRAASLVVTDEMRALIERYEKILADGAGKPLAGKTLFTARCATCHTLFGEGGRVGPDLTSFKRDDTRIMLLNITSPSAEIREGFENFLVKTKDGRRLTGVLVQQDKQMVTLRGADGQDVSLERAQIDLLKSAGMSLMPEGILEGLSDNDVRDLFAYLRSTQPPK